MDSLNIKKGTEEEWEDSTQDPNDIVFITDIPLIKTQGKTYGVPTWEGE